MDMRDIGEDCVLELDSDMDTIKARLTLSGRLPQEGE